MNNFLIIGHARSGTSLMQSVLDWHAAITCDYESMFKFFDFPKWAERCLAINNRNRTYGNKFVVEQLHANGWSMRDLKGLSCDWHIISMWRRYSHYQNRMLKSNLASLLEIKRMWEINNELFYYWKDAHPDKVLRVNFADFVLHPQIEVMRVLNFLGVEHNAELIDYLLVKGALHIQRYPAQRRIKGELAFT